MGLLQERRNQQQDAAEKNIQHSTRHVQQVPLQTNLLKE
jgi:hypothetical protein